MIGFEALRIEKTHTSSFGNKYFDPDKRLDVNEIRAENAEGEKAFDPDKRIEIFDNEVIGTTSAERKEFAGYSNGEWSGETGDSAFTPNSEIAKKTLADYGLECIDYADGNPDFSKCSEATVEIGDMTSDRAKNFRQADVECANRWNSENRNDRNDWTASDVKQWRQENHYSWHERIDMKTMDLVPRDIHEECKHFGGVAECKRYEAISNFGGEFDD